MKEKFSWMGQTVDAEVVNPSSSSEMWNEYLLPDGTVVRLKVVVKKMLKLEGVFDAERNPIYVTQTQNIISISCPESLKQPPGECPGCAGEHP